MSEQNELRAALLDAGLELIVKQGWHATTILQIVNQVGAPIVESVRLMPGKIGLLIALLDRLDEYVDEQIQGWADTESGPDRFFDVTMARFEAIQQNRAGVLAVWDGLAADPVAMTVVSPRYELSLSRTLEGAGLGADLIIGVGRKAAYAALLLDLRLVWAKDESPDMAATMAALGKRMEQANDLQVRLQNVPRDLSRFVESVNDG